jgi:hypothetical protein
VAAQEFDPWAEEKPQRRGCGWVILVLVVLAAAGALIWYYFNQKDPALAAVTASAGRVTLEKDDPGGLDAVDRRKKPEVWFRVTLDEAPVGKKLELTCEWLDPAGKVVHRNRFRTREITRSPWPTHARFRIAAEAPVGTWKVRLLLDGRELRTQRFEVRDGG